MLKLQFKDRRREAVWLVDQLFSIGKNSQNSLVINHPSVQDFHAEIVNLPDQLAIVDKSAGKALNINGKPVIGQSRLKENDVIAIGEVELELIDPKSLASTPAAAQSNSQQWRITSAASWLEKNSFNISGKMVIGRDAGCDITLPLDHLSRQHVQLEVRSNQLVVTDLDSANGTFLNGERINSAIAKPGDKIKLDVVTFEVHGPSEDPNKTIIRTAPGPAQSSPAKTAAKPAPAQPKKAPPPQARPIGKAQKLVADGKQDWIKSDTSETQAKPAAKSKLPLIIGIVIVVAVVASFIATKG